MFITALFTIARTWKQLRYLSIEDWIKKKKKKPVVHLYNGMLFSH